jgi:hypothetical protein
MFAFLGGLFGGVWSALAGFVTGILGRQQAETVGAQKVVVAQQAQTIQAETAIAQAEANAPKTQQQAVDAFDKDQV